MTESVSVTINIADSAPKLSNFGTLGIFAKCPYALDPRTYAASSTGLAAMLADGFAAHDEAYRMVSACASVSDGTPEIKVYPRAAQNAQNVELTPAVLTVGKKYTLGVIGAQGGEITATYTVLTGDDADDVVTAFVGQIKSGVGAVVTCSNATNGTYTIRIDGVNYSFVAATSTIAAICTGLTAAINGGANTFTATAGATTVTVLDDSGKKVTVKSVTSPTGSGLVITSQGDGPDVGLWITPTLDTGKLDLVPAVAGQRFALNGWSSAWTVRDVSADAGLATDLSNALASDPDFYGFCIDSNSEAELNAARTFAAATRRFFHGVTLDTIVGTNDDLDVGSDFLGASGIYAKVSYHQHLLEHPDCRTLAYVFGHQPTFGWEHIRVGCTAPAVGDTFLGYLDDKLVGYFKSERGETFFKNSKFPGRYPDLTRGFDWFRDRIEAACSKVHLDQAATGGATYTDLGTGAFKGAAQSEVALAIEGDLLARDPAPVVSALKVSSASPLDKANRHYNGVTVAGVIAGKIESLAVVVNVRT